MWCLVKRERSRPPATSWCKTGATQRVSVCDVTCPMFAKLVRLGQARGCRVESHAAKLPCDWNHWQAGARSAWSACLHARTCSCLYPQNHGVQCQSITHTDGEPEDYVGELLSLSRCAPTYSVELDFIDQYHYRYASSPTNALPIQSVGEDGALLPLAQTDSDASQAMTSSRAN